MNFILGLVTSFFCIILSGPISNSILTSVTQVNADIYFGGITQMFDSSAIITISNHYTKEVSLHTEQWTNLFKSYDPDSEDNDGNQPESKPNMHNMVGVLFFSPTCLYSHALLPIWDQVAKKLKGSLPLVRVDATRQQEEKMKKYNLRGYPGYPIIRLIVEHEGRLDQFEYEPRGWMTNMPTIVAWVKKHLDTDHIVTSLDEFKDFHYDNPVFVLGLFNEAPKPVVGNLTTVALSQPETVVTDGTNAASETVSNSTVIASGLRSTDQDGNSEKTAVQVKKPKLSIFAEASTHFENVLFAESRTPELSQQIAAYVENHHHLSCAVVNIGPSANNEKHVQVPKYQIAKGKLSTCHGPHNMQRSDWPDRFSVEVADDGVSINVKRTDKNEGWGQGLQYTCCCDDENSSTPLKVNIPAITMFTPHDEKVYRFEKPLDGSEDLHIKDIVDFVQRYRLPDVSEFTSETMNQVLESSTSAKLPILMFIRDKDPNDQKSIEMEKVIRSTAKKLKGRVLVAKHIMNSQDVAFRFLKEMLSLEDTKFPTVRLMAKNEFARNRNSAVKKYRLPENEPVTESALIKLTDDYHNGSLEQYLRSEPAPTPEDEDPYDPVKVVVGSTLRKYLTTRKKNVFINFYAPWCGHCKRLQPVWKELAARLIGNENVIEIAKLDATANEVPDLEIHGFPTLLFFANDGKEFEGREYHGERTSDAFISWLKDHVKKEPGNNELAIIEEDKKIEPKTDEEKEATKQIFDDKDEPLIEGESKRYNAGKGHSDEM